MTEKTLDLQELATEELRALMDNPPFMMELRPDIAFMLISQLQLAFRHPENVGPTRIIVENFALELQGLLCLPGSSIDTMLNMGKDPRFDVSCLSQGAFVAAARSGRDVQILSRAATLLGLQARMLDMGSDSRRQVASSLRAIATQLRLLYEPSPATTGTEKPELSPQ